MLETEPDPTPTDLDAPFLAEIPCVYRSTQPSRQVLCGYCGARLEPRNLYTCEVKGECFVRSIKLQGDYHAAVNCNKCRDRRDE